MKMMEEQMSKIGYDAKKMPLGKLSKETIRRGYSVLNKISEVLAGRCKGDLFTLSSEFYTVIPHDFGFGKDLKQHVINTTAKVKVKLEMVEALGDIEIAARLQEENSGEEEINIIDNNYNKLGCRIQAIQGNSEDHKLIEEYIKNTHAATHSTYTLSIDQIYKICRSGEEDQFIKSIGNEMLLWHGSRLTNYVGILSQGLRIAPPEAPSTGYMFGKGVYFADMVSKSANYCYASMSQGTGLMMLCRCAIGIPNLKAHADFNASFLPRNTHSYYIYIYIYI